MTDDDRRIAELASGYWINFVKTGDPNGAGLPVWRGYREPDASLLAIDSNPRPQEDEDRARHEFLASFMRSRA